jgi:hypothetical protein
MDDASIILVVTITSTLLGLILRYAFQSKCDRVSLLWGCCKVHREVEQETKIMTETENPQNKI